MRKLFTHPLGQLFLGLCALLLVVYFVAPLLGIKERLGAVLLVGFLAVVGLFIYALRTFAKEKALPWKLHAFAKKSASAGDPEAQEKLKQLEEAFEKAFDELAKKRDGSIFRTGSADHLPWIVILGPSGAGKSSALQNSGLRFTNFGQRVRGFGGTRNCAWWLAEEAIFLDTAGRYTTQEEDHDEWIGFLRLLRRYRKHRPIDAAILQVGMDELEHLSPAEIEEVALELQHRLDELIRDLGVRFPIHMVFSKCDRLDGFTSFFNTFSEEERAQVWGFGLDIDTLEGTSIGTAFNERFDQLVHALSSRVTARLHETSNRETQMAAMVFPRELANRRDGLQTFTRILFEPSRHREQPWLTGVYLVSATQEGQPLQGLRQTRAQNLGIAAPPPTKLEDPPAPYFVRGLFERVVDQARAAARPTETAMRRQRLRSRIALAVLFPFCLGGSWCLGRNYVGDSTWLAQVRKESAALVDAPPSVLRVAEHGRVGRQADNKAVEAELGRQETLRALLQARSSENLVRAAHLEASSLLRDRIDRLWIRPLESPANNDLREAASWDPRATSASGRSSDEVFADGFLALKLDYILQRGVCEETDIEDTREWAGDRVLEFWNREYVVERGGTREDKTGTRIPVMVSYFLDGGPPSGLQPDKGYVTEARKTLTVDVPSDDILYALVISNLGLTSVKKQLKNAHTFADTGLEEVYTPTGCLEFARASRENRDGAWWKCILKIQETPEITQIEQKYIEKYKEARQKWLNELTLVEGTEDLASTQQALMSVARGRKAELPQILHVLAGDQNDSTAEDTTRTDIGEKTRNWLDILPGSWRSFLSKHEKKLDDIPVLGDAGICRDAREPFKVFAQAFETGDAQDASLYEESESPASALKNFSESVDVLLAPFEKKIMENQQPAIALKLLHDNMTSASASLTGLPDARKGLINSLLSAGVNMEHLDFLLQQLEYRTAGSLIRLAAEGLQQEWKTEVYNGWNNILRSHADPNAIEICPDKLAYLKDVTKPFITQKLQPYYERNDYTNHKLAPILGHEMPLDDLVHTKLNNYLVIISTAKCPAASTAPPVAATPPPPPPEPPLPVDGKSWHPNYRNVNCPLAIERVIVDNGNEAVGLVNGRPRDRDHNVPSKGAPFIRALWHLDNPLQEASWFQVARANTYTELINKGHREGDLVVFKITTPRDCDHVLEIALPIPEPEKPAPPPQAQGGKSEKDPTLGIELPERIILENGQER